MNWVESRVPTMSLSLGLLVHPNSESRAWISLTQPHRRSAHFVLFFFLKYPSIYFLILWDGLELLHNSQQPKRIRVDGFSHKPSHGLAHALHPRTPLRARV